MESTIEQLDDAHVLVVSGRVDSASAKAFEDVAVAALKQAPKRLILDCSALDYISSAGLRVVLISAKAAKAAGKKFLLCGLQPQIVEIFSVSGFARILSIVPDRAAALSA